MCKLNNVESCKIFKRMYENEGEDPNFIRRAIKNFEVSRSTVYKWIAKIKLGKFIDKEERKPRKRKVTIEIEKYVLNRYNERKIVNMINLIRCVKYNFDVKISDQTVYNILHKYNITYKKVTFEPCPYDEETLNEKKNKLVKDIGTTDFKNIISIDEASFQVDLSFYGWSPAGQACSIDQYKARCRFSVCLAVTEKKLLAYDIKQGSFNGDVFKNFIEKKILNKHKNKILLMDNARIHKTCDMQKLFKKNKTCRPVYNIPYHPQTNPVEGIIRVIKSRMRKMNSRNGEQLHKNIKKTLALNINPKIFKNCFVHSFSHLPFPKRIDAYKYCDK